MASVITYAEFRDEAALLVAAQSLKERGIPMVDAYSPFPIHGIDSLLGIRRSRLPVVCFIAAAIGCVSSMWFQIWTSAWSWPVNVGGKPMVSWPAFIPVTFEVTILLGGLVTVGAFFLRSQLFPGRRHRMPDGNVTNDGFWIAVEHRAAQIDGSTLDALLGQLGATRLTHEEAAS